MNMQAAIPARFDKASQHARAMLAKIQIGRQQLGMDEDDYRQGLFDQIGKMSLKGATEAELAKVLDWLKSKGFQPMPKSTGTIGGKRAAMRPAARKARALWISLHHLGVVHNPAEEALEAFAKRQVKCDKLIWAREAQLYQLIEALKAMARRAGWLMHSPVTGKGLMPTELQSGLCHTILAKLKGGKAIPADWGLHEAMWQLCGIENAKDRPWSAEDYARLAAALGRKLREAGLAQEVNHGAR